MASGTKGWTVISMVAALGGATVAKKALNTGWRVATGKNPPSNPADPDVAMWEAVSWAVASGAGIALVRMAATRKAANYYYRSTGHLPPDLVRDDQSAQANEPTRS